MVFCKSRLRRRKKEGKGDLCQVVSRGKTERKRRKEGREVEPRGFNLGQAGEEEKKVLTRKKKFYPFFGRV